MLVQKLYKNGNSIAVTIPKELLRELDLRDGSEVIVSEDETQGAIVIEPKRQTPRQSTSLTPKFLKWLEDFNKEYGPALKELAKK
jgi:antitoxin component of MazEF toxin-antitoxin module